MRLELKTRRDIQALRGVSVLGVLLFHLFPTFFKSGFLGVDVFFVISGFLLTPSIKRIVEAERSNQKQQLKEFYLRRFFRLTPALVATVILFSIWMFLFGPLGEQRFAFIQGLTALVYLANFQAFRLSQGDYFNPDPNGLLHTWSLSTEEQIFIVLPFILIFLYSRTRVKFETLISTLFCLLIVFYLVINFTNLLSRAPFFVGDLGFYYFSPMYRAMEFFLGSLLFLNRDRLHVKILRSNKIYLIILSFVLFVPIKLTLLLPAGMLLTCLILLSPDSARKNSRTGYCISKIGDASYSIYLYHLPAIYIANQVFPGAEIVATYIRVLVALTLTFFFGFFSYHLIEQKFRRQSLTLPWEKQKYKIGCLIILPIILLLSLRVGAVNFYGLASPPSLVGTINCEQGDDLGYCGSFNGTVKQNFLLIGDSHAAALSEVFINEVSRRGGNPVVMYGRGCPITLTDIEMDLGKPTPCQEYMKAVMRIITEHKLVLFIAQRSSEAEWPSTNTTKELINGIKKLNESTLRTVVISPNPEFTKGMSQGNLSSLLSVNGASPRKSLPMAAFNDLALLNSAFKNSEITVIDSIDLFCSNESCSFKQSGKYLFWDSNHLSRDGAMIYAKEISKLIS